MTNWARWIVPIISVSILGCGGGSTSLPPERPAGDISGVAHDGRIVDGDVRIYSYANGVKGDLLASSTTDENGAFSANFAASDQPVLVEVDGGHYIEEASDTRVRVKSGQGLLALSVYKSGQPLVVNVTPLTMLAVGLAQYKIANGEEVAKAIEASNTELLDIFGVRVTSTTPRDIRVPGEVTETGSETVSESTLYGFLLASFSSYTEWLAEKNDGAFHDQFPSISLARLMYDDIRVDGILDGIAGLNDKGEPKKLTFAGAELNQNVYRSAIAQHMLVTASSPANKTGLRASDLLSRATSVASSDAPVFPGSNNASLDLDGPVITAKDSPGLFYRGDIQYEVNISDQSGLRVVSFALDGVTLGDATDVTSPATVVIQTDDFSDGKHTLDVTAFDDVGNLGSESFTLWFDNTDPQFTVTSPTLTNQDSMVMTGTYEKSGSKITKFTVRGNNATLKADSTWSANVSLIAGNNPISIFIQDEANNISNSTVIVAMDNVIPGFAGGEVVYSDEVLFDIGNSLCYVDKLSNVSQGSPLYINKNKAAVSNSMPQQSFGLFDLEQAKIPFIRFYVTDQVIDGVSTAPSQIKVEMQYSLGAAVLAPYKTLSIHDDPDGGTDPYYLIPLASDYLHPDWTTSSPQDEHKIAIRLTDNAGNVRNFPFSFWTVFGDTDCSRQLGLGR